MNNRTEAKLTDLSGMQKAIEEILKQAWERGRKYGYKKGYEDAKKETKEVTDMKSTLTLMCNCCKKPIGYLDTDILSEFGSAISKTCIYGKTSTIYCPECWAKETQRSEEE